MTSYANKECDDFECSRNLEALYDSRRCKWERWTTNYVVRVGFPGKMLNSEV